MRGKAIEMLEEKKWRRRRRIPMNERTNKKWKTNRNEIEWKIIDVIRKRLYNNTWIHCMECFMCYHPPKCHPHTHILNSHFHHSRNHMLWNGSRRRKSKNSYFSHISVWVRRIKSECLYQFTVNATYRISLL